MCMRPAIFFFGLFPLHVRMHATIMQSVPKQYPRTVQSRGADRPPYKLGMSSKNDSVLWEFRIELRTVRVWIADCPPYKFWGRVFGQRLGVGGHDSRTVRL
jgi:hypothetical protein